MFGRINVYSRNVFTLPNIAVLCTPFPGMVRAFTLTEVIKWRTAIYHPGPYTYWPFHFDVNVLRQLRGTRGGTWVEVLLCCLYNKDNAAIST